MKCPKLNSISLSQVTPPECVTTELRFNSRCTFQCPSGYLFQGTPDRSVLRFCKTDGTWTGEHKPCIGEEFYYPRTYLRGRNSENPKQVRVFLFRFHFRLKTNIHESVNYSFNDFCHRTNSFLILARSIL